MATITIPDDLQRAAEEYARQTGQTLDQLIERLLASVALRRAPVTTTEEPSLPTDDEKGIAEVEDLAEKLRLKYNLQPLPPALAALRGSVKLPADSDHKQILSDSLWKKYSTL